ncbi:MAG TPA: hypothetical protein VF719_10955, partial [Abditibacteriaceae bacterium]
QRTKIAVAASNPDVDPVGACVGPRGNRVGKVVAELGNEKVDIVRWNADPIAYISNALSPAQISKVILIEDSGNSEAAGTATVIVAEDQQSLAIGKQGQNVRLAAKLTGWRIDIRTEKQYAEEQAKKMFDLDATPAPATVTVRESEDEHAKLFAVDADDTVADTTDEGELPPLEIPADPAIEPDASTAGLFPVAVDDESTTENAADAGTAAPDADVETPAAGINESVEGTTDETPSSVAPDESVQA